MTQHVWIGTDIENLKASRTYNTHTDVLAVAQNDVSAASVLCSVLSLFEVSTPPCYSSSGHNFRRWPKWPRTAIRSPSHALKGDQ